MQAWEDFILERMRRTKLAGVSVAVVHHDQVVHQRGFGLRDIARGRPATPRTLYGIGSITKSFTCLAILQLQERGKLHVDDPIDQHLPGFPVRPFGKQVRLKHLMTHTSGIPGLAYAEAAIGQAQGQDAPWLPLGGAEDMLTFLRDAGDWAHSKPGDRWFYLNEGYALLGEVVARASGQPYAAYVTEHILRPLGMVRSLFDHDAFLAEADAAVPYNLKDGSHKPGVYLFGRILADGGLISSAEEMARYARLYLTGGGAIAARDSIDEMMKPRIATPPVEWPGNGRLDEAHHPGQYGYGLSVDLNFFGQRLVGHSGSVGVATAYMGLLPDSGYGVVVLANGSGYSPTLIGQFALATLADEDPWRIPALRSERALDAVTGTYQTYRGTMTVTVKREGDFLLADFGGQAVPLVPFDYDPERPRCFTLTGGRRLIVEFERSGSEVEMIYERYKLRRAGRGGADPV